MPPGGCWARGPPASLLPVLIEPSHLAEVLAPPLQTIPLAATQEAQESPAESDVVACAEQLATAISSSAASPGDRSVSSAVVEELPVDSEMVACAEQPVTDISSSAADQRDRFVSRADVEELPVDSETAACAEQPATAISSSAADQGDHSVSRADVEAAPAADATSISDAVTTPAAVDDEGEANASKDDELVASIARCEPAETPAATPATTPSAATPAMAIPTLGGLHPIAATTQVSILDCFILMAQRKSEDSTDEAFPSAFAQFESQLGEGISGLAAPTHSRLGLRNDANNCYVNVVVQSLLPCAALMWLLRNCGPADASRPFYSCLVSLFREFFMRGDSAHGQVFYPLALPAFQRLLTSWRKVGAQQDAGEFLFYVLNGLHEECKWSTAVARRASSLEEGGGAQDEEAGGKSGGWAQLVREGRREVERRAAGLQEDSPIRRIFGGLVESAVRARSAKADSISVEPFNHLDLDISEPGVNSISTALDAFCKEERVSDGQLTRRLRIRELPKVLILNLKRFTYHVGNGRGSGPQKVTKAVRFDERLRFGPQWLALGVAPKEYALTGVICHHGESASSGHYTAAVRYGRDWFTYDDTVVKQVLGAEVAQLQAAVYLLVYQRAEKVNFLP